MDPPISSVSLGMQDKTSVVASMPRAGVAVPASICARTQGITQTVSMRRRILESTHTSSIYIVDSVTKNITREIVPTRQLAREGTATMKYLRFMSRIGQSGEGIDELDIMVIEKSAKCASEQNETDFSDQERVWLCWAVRYGFHKAMLSKLTTSSHKAPLFNGSCLGSHGLCAEANVPRQGSAHTNDESRQISTTRGCAVIITQILMTGDKPKSLFAPYEHILVYVAGGSSERVSLYLETPRAQGDKGEGEKDGFRDAFEVLDIDTLLVDVDRPALSWSLARGSSPPIELFFIYVKELDDFLFCLSYVRLKQAHSLVEYVASQISPPEGKFQNSHVKEFFAMRATIYGIVPIHVLPAEILSEIFVHHLSLLDKSDHTKSILLLLRVCSKWRVVALETAGLWRSPSFTLGPSFFRHNHRNSCSQMLSWLKRAKSEMTLFSLTFDDSSYSATQALDASRFDPSLLGAIRALKLSSPQSQLHPFLGHDLPIFSSLETLSLSVPTLNLEPWPIYMKLCRSALILRKLTIETACLTSPFYTPGLIAAFPWARLTTLSMKIDLGISTWMPIFSQCISLQTGEFILWDDLDDYPQHTVAFEFLVSFRASFRHVCNTQFFAHFDFPVIRELHIAGLVAAGTKAPFMPTYSTLRVLILDIELPNNVLQQIIRAHPLLEQLNVFTDSDGGVPSAVREGRLRRLRNLTVSTFITAPLDRLFVTIMAKWLIETVRGGCCFRFFGGNAVLRELCVTLNKDKALKASVKFDPHVDSFEDPYERFPYSRFWSLDVETLESAFPS
ncbi:hypothetical protein B0H19DRAFT_1084410 [Mycena capillaripes]|nr:hypothetical protein B0H19DRAFT_1084410 [Mycena capillaripes]